jgi:hypothetical protein
MLTPMPRTDGRVHTRLRQQLVEHVAHLGEDDLRAVGDVLIVRSQGERASGQVAQTYLDAAAPDRGREDRTGCRIERQSHRGPAAGARALTALHHEPRLDQSGQPGRNGRPRQPGDPCQITA